MCNKHRIVSTVAILDIIQSVLKNVAARQAIGVRDNCTRRVCGPVTFVLRSNTDNNRRYDIVKEPKHT